MEFELYTFNEKINVINECQLSNGDLLWEWIWKWIVFSFSFFYEKKKILFKFYDISRNERSLLKKTSVLWLGILFKFLKKNPYIFPFVSPFPGEKNI